MYEQQSSNAPKSAWKAIKDKASSLFKPKKKNEVVEYDEWSQYDSTPSRSTSEYYSSDDAYMTYKDNQPNSLDSKSQRYDGDTDLSPTSADALLLEPSDYSAQDLDSKSYTQEPSPRPYSEPASELDALSSTDITAASAEMSDPFDQIDSKYSSGPSVSYEEDNYPIKTAVSSRASPGSLSLGNNDNVNAEALWSDGSRRSGFAARAAARIPRPIVKGGSKVKKIFSATASSALLLPTFMLRLVSPLPVRLSLRLLPLMLSSAVPQLTIIILFSVLQFTLLPILIALGSNVISSLLLAEETLPLFELPAFTFLSSSTSSSSSTSTSSSTFSSPLNVEEDIENNIQFDSEFREMLSHIQARLIEMLSLIQARVIEMLRQISTIIHRADFQEALKAIREFGDHAYMVATSFRPLLLLLALAVAAILTSSLLAASRQWAVDAVEDKVSVRSTSREPVAADLYQRLRGSAAAVRTVCGSAAVGTLILSNLAVAIMLWRWGVNGRSGFHAKCAVLGVALPFITVAVAVFLEMYWISDVSSHVEDSLAQKPNLSESDSLLREVQTLLDHDDSVKASVTSQDTLFDTIQRWRLHPVLERIREDLQAATSTTGSTKSTQKQSSARTIGHQRRGITFFGLLGNIRRLFWIVLITITTLLSAGVVLSDMGRAVHRSPTESLLLAGLHDKLQRLMAIFAEFGGVTGVSYSEVAKAAAGRVHTIIFCISLLTWPIFSWKKFLEQRSSFLLDLGDTRTLLSLRDQERTLTRKREEELRARSAKNEDPDGWTNDGPDPKAGVQFHRMTVKEAGRIVLQVLRCIYVSVASSD